ncbi:grasp-with-spasm system SPASM domain peptide maturase [uncultured Psychroserpens sp.]|uniref:grasp-with-spasm system SPASM domain peptide maturase n=1 Tax=uncultured Psychroserpens sp. TaxID=255436 RepID=UPI00261FB586|nr:grasp-with-spasm system SPASM domain peptide maturase [uncultured Psychroserpens sp.]
MTKEVPVLYASCIPVKGAAKSIICDLQRQNYVHIPNDLYNILTEHSGKSLEEIKIFYENKYDNIIDNYFQILFKHDFAFLTDTPELFPKLQLEWHEPFEITNAIVDIDSSSKFELNTVLNQLSSLSCKFVQIRFYRNTSIKEIENIFRFLNTVKSNSIGIELLIPFNKSLNDTNCLLLFKNFKRLNSLIVYNSPQGKRIKPIGNSKYYINTGVDITSEKHCGCIDKSLFSINIKVFSESQKFNSCLNGKISIDKNGDIKNCPSMPDSFGNINTNSLEQAILDKHFKKYWNLNKDDIDICKDCEFRYICTDCRAYVEDPENVKSKPLKCGYNPYKGEWKDWSESKLKKESITYYNL